MVKRKLEPFLKKKFVEVVDDESPELVKVLLTLIMDHCTAQDVHTEVGKVYPFH
jgi:hypothetical protein